MSTYFVQVLIYAIVISMPKPEIFHGKVTYVDSYESRDPNVSVALLEKLLGNTREFFIDRQFYKSIYYGEVKRTILYRGDVNRIYRFSEDSDTVYWMDAAVDTLSTITEFSREESVGTILGFQCEKLRIVTKRGVTTYFFNDDYALLPEEFSRHKLESWDVYTSTTRALPLKIIFETPGITVTSTATKIEKMTLPKATFEIPPGHLERL